MVVLDPRSQDLQVVVERGLRTGDRGLGPGAGRLDPPDRAGRVVIDDGIDVFEALDENAALSKRLG